MNPYSGVPKTGYIIYTTDANGGSIDSTSGSITLSVQVSTWASFSSYYIARTDGITQVDTSSEGDVFFSLALPTDATCRLYVYFPSDMPLTSALTTLSGAGVMATSGYVSPTSTNTAASTTYFYMNGCSSYSDSPSKGELFLDYMVNAG